MNNPRLQSLRIPSGWNVKLNDFTEIDPNRIKEDDEEIWFNFKQDLLQVENKRSRIIVDLGWYPDFCSEGSFRLVIVRDYQWDEPIHSIQTSD
ncbi:hypothetical protein EDM56_01925 [Brevibacillus fluminis]|uniref:Uncharacterized protein n=1 Tax=Brevibacillus fluminis TaxID=511487 RepID=A0A3M8DWH5_9BACL|nr:hypothetical protein [Brevibacillus fluminis]RNB92476.1 hypothetical protein EDM56_01925 [Brevibacillus fluminis]